MLEVPGADPRPQADTKIFASDHFAGLRDQRTEYLPRLCGEFDFVTGLNSKGPKATFRGREDCRSIKSLDEAMLTQMISPAEEITSNLFSMVYPVMLIERRHDYHFAR